MFKKSFIKFLALCIGFILAQYSFCADSHTPDSPKQREIVVLIHGLMRTNLSMVPLRFYLQKHGYEATIYTYISARYTIHEHSRQLNEYIGTLIAENPEARISFVTHSLGGIIAREALSHLNKKQLEHVNSLVMLAPPNQGSRLAKLSLKTIPFISASIKPMSELSSDENAYVHKVPVPPVRIGIIAGRYDAKVPPAFARLEGQAEPVVINTTHTFIMYKSRTKELVLQFLQHGAFHA